MDNPKKLSESGASQPPDPDAGQGFGATGIFAAMSEPESPNPPSMGIEPWPELEKAQKPEPPVRGQEMGATALVEPVVHRVVLPQGNDAPSNDLIDRIRNAAAEREPDQAKAPLIGAQGSQPAMRNAAPGAEGGDAGFTQLLRSMGLESQAPQAPAKPAPAMAPQRSASTDGFTAMLSAFKSPAGTMPAGATPAGSVSAADQHSGAGFAPAPAASEPRPAEPQSQDRPGFTQQFSGAVGESRTFRAVPGQSATPPPVAPPPASRPNPPAPASQPAWRIYPPFQLDEWCGLRTASQPQHAEPRSRRRTGRIYPTLQLLWRRGLRTFRTASQPEHTWPGSCGTTGRIHPDVSIGRSVNTRRLGIPRRFEASGRHWQI